MKQQLTPKRAHELLEYDPETGAIRRRKTGMVAGTRHCCGYVQLSVDGKAYLAHRVAWLLTHDHWPSGEIDHRNGIKNDNRLANLRDCTHAENKQNIRRANKNSRSGLLGITQGGGRWFSRIKLGGKRHYLGSFKTPEEAHSAYLRAKSQLHPFSTISGGAV